MAARVARALRLPRGRPAGARCSRRRGHVPRARHAGDLDESSSRHRRPTVYVLGDARPRRTRRHASPRACTTNATAPTCSAPTSAPGLSHARSRSASARRWRAASASWCIAAGRRALGEVTSSSSTTRASGRRAATRPATTSCAPSASRRAGHALPGLMPDVLHWLGVRASIALVSMSNMKYDAITGAGIEVGERVQIPEDLIPADARWRWTPEGGGYFTDGEFGGRPSRRTRAAASDERRCPAPRQRRSSSSMAVRERSRNIAQAVDARRAAHFPHRPCPPRRCGRRVAHHARKALSRSRHPVSAAGGTSRWRRRRCARRSRTPAGAHRPRRGQRAARCRRRTRLDLSRARDR